jgi:glycine betaine/proline transport system substrate-binding protein
MKLKLVKLFDWKRTLGALALTAAITSAVLMSACGGVQGASGGPTPVGGETPSQQVGPDQSKPTIRLSDTQFESLWINNAIAEFVIEHGYGYPVETVEVTTPIMQASLAKGDLDVVMEVWQQNIIDWYEQETSRGNIVNLGMTYEGGPQFFVIPRWVAEEYNIKTVFDMKDHWDLFKDPEDLSRGAFINCIIGWQCAEINRAKMAAYGLDQYYNIISPGSSGAMEVALSGAMKKRKPVFGYYWAPTALMGQYDWHILEEPEHTAGCWEEVIKGRDNLEYTPQQACAYETLPVDKAVHQGMLDKSPEVVELLKKMNVGLEPLNRTAAWAKETNIQGDWEKAAIYYLRTYEERWSTWMPEEQRQKVEAALSQTGR